MKKLMSIFMAAALAVTIAGCGSSSSKSGEGETIKIGYLQDQSGEFSVATLPKYHAAQLAVEEINKDGGILGKQVELIAPDTQSDTTKAQEMAKKLILEDKVDVLMGGYSSPGREAIRSIVEQQNQLFMYNNQYEGGDASHNVFCTGLVPETQISTLMEAMVKDYGKKIYIIAADYNFGQISGAWTKKVVEEYGGEIVGEEYIPLSVSQFSSTISKIKQANPDVLVTYLVGTAQSSFYEQWATAGIKNLPMASTINMTQTYEHKRFQPPAMANMHATTNYMEELDTEASNKFKENYYKKFPDDEYIGEETEAEYTGIYLYKEAVEKAGTTDVEKVIEAFESGEISYDGPAGTVTIDGATHQAIRDLRLVKCDENHKISFLQEWKAVKPDWLSEEMDVDLRKSAPNKQFTPID